MFAWLKRWSGHAERVARNPTQVSLPDCKLGRSSPNKPHATEEDPGRRQAGPAGLASTVDASKTKEEIMDAHHAVCTCGGAGPGYGCPACEMYHALYYTPNDQALPQPPGGNGGAERKQ